MKIQFCGLARRVFQLAFVLIVGSSAAVASPMSTFTLDCAGCPGPGQTVSWTTPTDATLAPEYFDSFSGWFHIQVAITGTSSGVFDFYAHDAPFGGGINLCWTGSFGGGGCSGSTGYTGDDFTPSFDLIFTTGPQVFSGPTSAPTWLPGEYDMVEVFSGYGPVHLSITSVSEPASLALLGLGLAGLGFNRRKRA